LFNFFTSTINSPKSNPNAVLDWDGSLFNSVTFLLDAFNGVCQRFSKTTLEFSFKVASVPLVRSKTAWEFVLVIITPHVSIDSPTLGFLPFAFLGSRYFPLI
jgi:hypothetical protein